MILSANRFPLRRIMRYRTEGVRVSQPLDGEARDASDRGEPFDRGKTVAARRNQLFQFRFAKTAYEAKAEPHGVAGSHSACRRGGRLQGAIPIAVIDVDGADFHAVLACIAHQLRRLIETHRLTVENGGAEHVGIAAFDESRGINQKRKTRRVTFGKAIFAETFD